MHCSYRTWSSLAGAALCVLCWPAVHSKCKTLQKQQTWCRYVVQLLRLCSQAHAFMGELHSYLHIDYTSPGSWVCCTCCICTYFFLPMKSSADIWDSYPSSLPPYIHTPPQQQWSGPILVPLLPSIPLSLLKTNPCTKAVFPWDTLTQFHSLQLPGERGGSPQSFALPAVLALGHPAAYLALVLACVGSLH